jgi:hypothetical protein
MRGAASAICFVMTMHSAIAETVAYSCPRAGTSTTSERGITLYHGPVPDNAVLCRRTSARGKDETLYYNWFSNSESAAKFGEILAGKSSSFTIEYDVDFGMQYLPFQHMREDWRYEGREVLTVAGLTTSAMVFEREVRMTTRINHGKWRMWLDPSTGLWIRGRYTIISGTYPSAGGAWEDFQIKLPD